MYIDIDHNSDWSRPEGKLGLTRAPVVVEGGYNSRCKSLMKELDDRSV